MGSCIFVIVLGTFAALCPPSQRCFCLFWGGRGTKFGGTWQYSRTKWLIFQTGGSSFYLEKYRLLWYSHVLVHSSANTYKLNTYTNKYLYCMWTWWGMLSKARFFFSEDVDYLSIILKMWSTSMHRALNLIPALHKLAVVKKKKKTIKLLLLFIIALL